MKQPLKALLCLFSLMLSTLCAAQNAGEVRSQQEIDASFRDVVQELSGKCPFAGANDQVAFDSCRKALFGESKLRNMLSPITIWGRQTDPNKSLADTHLTQFGPDVLAGMYLPLFMFNGKYTLSFNEREQLYQAKLQVAFRNRLAPGQFPYPFWHDDNKWTTYENAKTILLWINPKNGKVRFAQFTKDGDRPELAEASHVSPPPFSGDWLWTDSSGKTQPAVTLFDGLFSDNNPYKPQVAESYKDFAISLRKGQCMSCHVPNNPNKMDRLVLLQTPVHAAAEIKRVLKEVRKDGMPVDKFGSEEPLDPEIKKIFIEKGEAFDRLVDAARAWERSTRLASAAAAQ